jgi:two-component system nitrogen regulation response regulator GlnG
VEDDVDQCQELAEFIRGAGLEVAMAYGGMSGLREAGRRQPRVALLDYNLPDGTGVELAEKLRALLPEMAIIMMSGRIDGLSEKTLEKTGITVFVNKPLPLAPLRKAILKLAHARPRHSDHHHQRGWMGTGFGGTR